MSIKLHNWRGKQLVTPNTRTVHVVTDLQITSCHRSLIPALSMSTLIVIYKCLTQVWPYLKSRRRGWRQPRLTVRSSCWLWRIVDYVSVCMFSRYLKCRVSDACVAFLKISLLKSFYFISTRRLSTKFLNLCLHIILKLYSEQNYFLVWSFRGFEKMYFSHDKLFSSLIFLCLNFSI